MQVPGHDTRSALLAAAEAEVAERGATSASLRSVARRAGVSHQTPGHHFDDRAGLYTAVAAVAYDALADALGDAASTAGADPTDRLAAVGCAYVAFGETRPGLFAVITSPSLWRTHAEPVLGPRDRAWGVLGDAVDDAVAAGWGAGRPREDLVLLCFSAVHGIAALVRDGLLSSELDDAVAADVARAVTGALSALGRAGTG